MSRDRPEDARQAVLGIDPGSVRVRSSQLGGGTSDGEPADLRDVEAAAEDRADRVHVAVTAAGRLARRVAVVVPDAWSSGGTAGVVARENLARALVTRFGEVLPIEFVESSAAIVASSVDGRSVDGALLVCDLAGSAVRSAWCVAGTDGIRVLRTATAGYVGNGASFDEALLRSLPAGSAAAPDVREALQKHSSRLAHAVTAAATRHRYLTTPALRVGESWLSTATVADAFAPLTRAVRSTVTTVSGDQAGARKPIRVLLTGGAAAFPLARRTVEEALGRRAALIDTLEPHAAAHGAALISAGRVRVQAPSAPGPILVDRVADGLLEAGELSIAAEPVVEVGVPTDGLIRLRQGGRVRTIRPAGGTPPPPTGLYQVAFWPNREDAGAIVLRPTAGGDSILYAITSTTPEATSSG